MTGDEYLELIKASREEAERFLTPGRAPAYSPNRGWYYDGELGWTLTDSVRRDGIDGSLTFYHYEDDGARRVINGAGLPSRVHCFGNSMTHCDQVSDGESWAEYLAGHLREPVRNFGVGGYSVYQAWRRLEKVESAHPEPAELVILNIFDDDHFRNLDSWRTIRFGRRTACGFTLPHLRVNVAAGRCEERPNPCPRPEDVYRLADLDFLKATFADDPVLRLVVAHKQTGPVDPKEIEAVEVSFGLPPDSIGRGAGAEEARHRHGEAALFASRWVLGRVLDFTRGRGQKLLVVLSRGRRRLEKIFAGESPRWDQSFLDFLAGENVPVVDLGEAHRAEFETMKLDWEEYCRPYFIGHYTPYGNFFTCRAVKDRVVSLLDPPPAPYRA